MSDISPRGGLAELKAKALAKGVPLIAHLELTHRCRWSCLFCCNPPLTEGHELDFWGWRRVLTDLRELGTLFVTLTGGDPLLHPEFFEIAAAARRLGMALRVFTNGSAINDRAAGRLAGLRCLSVELSMHGATDESHDEVTRRRGSFRQLWHAVERLQAHSVPVVLKCPVSRLNENELPGIISVAEENGLPLRLDPTIVVGDDGDQDPLRWRATPAGVQKTMEVLADHNQLPVAENGLDQPVCGVGANTLAIDPYGFVYPCIQWRHDRLGNVRATPLRGLWRDSAARGRAASAAREAGTMLAERYDAVSRYPFCPALAAREHADPLAIGPFLQQQAETADALRSV